MGRDVAGLRINNKRPNAKSNSVDVNRVHVSPKIAMEKVETKEHEVEDQTPRGTCKGGSQGKQDVLAAKSTNTEGGLTEGKTEGEAVKPSEKKLSSPIKPAPETAAAESLQPNSFTSQTPELLNERRTSHLSHASETDGAVFSSSNSSDHAFYLSAKKSEPNSSLISRKPVHSNDDKKHYDDEDNHSLASSGATSVRTIRSKVTVGVAPTFKSAERARRRKEFYMKLEEKHKALEAEKQEYAARTKEEEETAIQQLRKTMVYKANPVPSFYREGPPPKVELKKLPVTRPKSPNLTRRKSCSDAVKESADEKACGQGTRHSIGVYRGGTSSPKTPKTKDLSSTRNVNGHSIKDSNGASKLKTRPKQVKETAKTSHTESDQTSTDIPVVAETKNCYTTADNGIDIPLLENKKEACLAMNTKKGADITHTEDATKTSHTATEQRTANGVHS